MPRKILFFISVIVFCSSSAIIKVGNVLEIQVLSQPEFSGRYTVHENGTIDYPLLADEQITNISTSELMNDLTLRLARHVDNPLVTVSIVEKPEIAVTVLGEVVNPGPVKILEGATLQEAIRGAGGPLETSDMSRIKIVHSNRNQSAEIFDLNNFLQKGNIDEMPRLEANDMIVVMAQEHSKKIKVIGSVQKPGLFELTDKMSVFEIIYLAGGPAEKADLSRVRRLSVTNGGKTVEDVIDVQSYIDKGKMDNLPLVSEGDVIIVYSKWFDWKTVMTILNNTLLFVLAIQTFAGVFK
jgi:protein involved in polysaccharide export with SLBB domain